ncbi:MAG TPA: hypothetical protein GX707_10415 [Epulopiscium sp.]|nr:hypothetical protein [Candidatus Epulonipiscium sp.]
MKDDCDFFKSEYVSIELKDKKYTAGEKGVNNIRFWHFFGQGVTDPINYSVVELDNDCEILISQTIPHVVVLKPSLQGGKYD